MDEREWDRNRSFVRIRFRRPTSAQLQQSGRLLKVADKGNFVSLIRSYLELKSEQRYQATTASCSTIQKQLRG